MKNLDKAFVNDGRTITAIDQLSLSIEEHEFVSIVGPSGCGKSTFLHIVGGFEPATAGELRLNGRPIGPPGPDRGMMFQDLSLFPWLTAIENVAWPLEMKGLAKAERLTKAREYLDLVHLARYGDLYPGQLSGGMKQRVALARLFALDPEVMLMDEPFGALDSQTRELLQEELQSIWRRTRKTALFVTHDIDESIYLATRLIVFTARPGRIKADIRNSERRSIRRLPQVEGISRSAGSGLGPAAGGSVEGEGAGGNVRIKPALILNWTIPIVTLVAWEVLRPPRFVAPPFVSANVDSRGVVGACSIRRTFCCAGGEPLSRRARIHDRNGHGCGRRARCGNRAWRQAFLRSAGFVSLFDPEDRVSTDLLLLFGLGHASKISIIAFSVFFPVFVASRHSVLSINPILVWAAQNMGTPPRTIFFRVVIPAAAPGLFAGIRIGLAHAFVVLFAAELIGSKAGLANLISFGEEWVRFDIMFAGIVCFAVLGFVSDRILMAIRRHVLKGHLIGTEEQVVQ